jgi:predicted alpha/beta superfamily hydrolase
MKKTLILFLTIIVLLNAQEKVKVKLEVISPPLNDTSKVFVAGSGETFGNWKPDAVMLSYNGSKTWSRTFEILKGTRLEYKFTKGSWATEALGRDSSVPQNSILIANRDTTVSTTIFNWRDKFNFKVKGQITGKVFYNKHFTFPGLKPRDIFVWLPPNYETEKEKRFPVFYMHDGQNLVDPRTSNTFIDWQVDETADSLMRAREIEPFILVGINNTDDRGMEYRNSPLGLLYMKLIVEKIKPFIDQEYRTLTDAKNTAVGGSSMGGLISLMCAWTYPDIFSKAACFSPAFTFRDFDYTKTVQEDNSNKNSLTIYIDNGGVGLEAQLQPGVDKMIEVLREKNFVENKNLFVFIDKNAEHNEAAWAKRVWRPLKIFFGVK